VTALSLVAVLPILSIGSTWLRTRRLNAIGGVSLLVILLGVAASLITGDPRIVLGRESLISAGWSVACLVSLTGVRGIRPLMFYMARQMGSGGDPGRMAAFDRMWAHGSFRLGMARITAVWAVIYLVEAVTRVIMVLTLPAATVLAVSPILLGGVTVLTGVWTIGYSRGIRQQVAG
jgi:hypothetical protein